MTGHLKGDPMLGMNIEVSRNLETNLTFIARKWRHEHIDMETLEPIFPVHRRDLVEMFLSYLFFIYRDPEEFHLYPPNVMLTEDFMELALQCRAFECEDRLTDNAVGDKEFETWVAKMHPTYGAVLQMTRVADVAMREFQEESRDEHVVSDEEFEASYKMAMELLDER